MTDPLMPSGAGQYAAAAVKSPIVLLAQLKATLLAQVGRVVELREDPVKHASGPVIAANERWAAMHIGRETQLLDRQQWPVEVGHCYELHEWPNGRQVKERPMDSRTQSGLEYVYGKQVGELAKGWVERDVTRVQAQKRDRGMGGPGC